MILNLLIYSTILIRQGSHYYPASGGNVGIAGASGYTSYGIAGWFSYGTVGSEIGWATSYYYGTCGTSYYYSTAGGIIYSYYGYYS